MASHQAFEVPPALRSNGRPKAPLVNIALVRPAVKAPARKPWSQPQIDDKGFIPPKALRPQDFEEPCAFPMRRLIALVSGVSWVRQVDILSERRQNDPVKARQTVFWLARRFTTLSYPQIGRHIGGRDHSTIIHGVSRVQSVIDRLDIEVTDCPVEMAECLWAAEWPRVLK